VRTYRFLGRPAIADRLTQLLTSDRAGQPLLLLGPEGSGKEATALEVARRINCVAPGTCRPDHPCESCQKAASFQHPDIRWLGPAPAGLEDPRRAGEVRDVLEAKMANPFHQPDFAATSQILIGKPDAPGPLTVRSLVQFLQRHSFQGRWKVAVVADAQRLNPAAGNALLKTLEEPPEASLIILLTTSTAGVLPTIVSRCQQVRFEPYPADQLAEILATLAPDAEPAVRRQASAVADGNARKAVALLQPEARAIRDWAEEVLGELAAGRALPGQTAAEALHRGAVPGLEPPGRKRGRGGDQEEGLPTGLGGNRQRALLFCETLAYLLGRALAAREAATEDPPDPATGRLARHWSSEQLLAAISRTERAKHQIDGNLNLGLVLAGLLQELSGHAGARA
jgi:DNA polymerase-3 subunit delta'